MEDIFMMDNKEVEKLKETTVIKGGEFSHEGNTFTALSSTAETYELVWNVYIKRFLRDSDFASARYNIFTFRFKDEEGGIHHGYCDNGEYGVGRPMLKALADHGILMSLSLSPGNSVNI